VLGVNGVFGGNASVFVWRINARGTGTRIGMERDPHEQGARVRLGSFEFKKKGVSRFDMRDPYHLAVALTWPQFLATLLAIYLLVNVVFATLYWLIPGSVANAGRITSGTFSSSASRRWRRSVTARCIPRRCTVM
jgi:hypothetical protein